MQGIRIGIVQNARHNDQYCTESKAFRIDIVQNASYNDLYVLYRMQGIGIGIHTWYLQNAKHKDCSVYIECKT